VSDKDVAINFFQYEGHERARYKKDNSAVFCGSFDSFADETILNEGVLLVSGGH
jgi:hypothetical protein